MTKVYAVVLTKDCNECCFGSMMICDTFHNKEDAKNYIIQEATKSSVAAWKFIARHQILEIGIH